MLLRFLHRRWLSSGLLWLGCFFCTPLLHAEQTPVIAIVIDDLGHEYKRGKALIDMPYALTCAFLPRRPYTAQLAQRAAKRGKEVMLHLPMQSNGSQFALGYGGLTIDLTQREFKSLVRESLRSLPHATGINNHMGSLLTRHPGHMAWLMQVLAEEDKYYYFVDSRTTARTVASKIANEYFIPNVTRDVFLDSSRRREDVDHQINRLIATAKRKGYALAIGHPYPVTIAALEKALPRIERSGIEIVPVTGLIQRVRAQRWLTAKPEQPTKTAVN